MRLGPFLRNSLYWPILRNLYWPICRAYARHVLRDEPADVLFRFLCSVHFWNVYHYWPNFAHPQRFTERLWDRMLHDRDQRWTLITDKLKVREYIAERIGTDYLVPLLWHGRRPEEIPYQDLPPCFVIKANHGSGYVLIVKDKAGLDRARTERQLRRWLSQNYCTDKFLGTEWGYKHIRPSILIEALLEEDGGIPADYKFYCFSGRVEVVSVFFGRTRRDKPRFLAFDRDFSPLRSGIPSQRFAGDFKFPPNSRSMILLAESLAAEWDFIRVDLYNIRGRIYFGELTPYPSGVSSIDSFDVLSRDAVLGQKWRQR